MYYCFCCPPPSFIVLELFAFIFHESFCQVFSVRHLARIKVTRFFLCGNVQPTASQCVHIVLFPPGNISPLVADAPLFFKSFTCSDKNLISCWCMATVLTEIARLADNSASKPLFAAVCMAAAAIFSKYPSSESIIWFVSGGFPTVFLCSCLHSFLLAFSGAAPNRAEPQKYFSSPYRAASARLFAT